MLLVFSEVLCSLTKTCFKLVKITDNECWQYFMWNIHLQEVECKKILECLIKVVYIIYHFLQLCLSCSRSEIYIKCCVYIIYLKIDIFSVDVKLKLWIERIHRILLCISWKDANEWSPGIEQRCEIKFSGFIFSPLMQSLIVLLYFAVVISECFGAELCNCFHLSHTKSISFIIFAWRHDFINLNISVFFRLDQNRILLLIT